MVKAFDGANYTQSNEIWHFETDEIKSTLDKKELKHGLFVSPNPFVNQLTIITPNVKGNILVKIIDLQGKIQFSKMMITNGKIIINDLDKLSRGAYFINIHQQNTPLQVGKIIKM